MSADGLDHRGRSPNIVCLFSTLLCKFVDFWLPLRAVSFNISFDGLLFVLHNCKNVAQAESEIINNLFE